MGLDGEAFAGLRNRPFVIADGGLAQLLAVRCEACSGVMFPPQSSCGRCGGEDVEVIQVGPAARVWSATVQTFQPPSPPYAVADTAETFQPYGVVIAEFEGGLLVHGRLDGSGLAPIGAALETAAIRLALSAGGEVETYGFRLVDQGAAQ